VLSLRRSGRPTAAIGETIPFWLLERERKRHQGSASLLREEGQVAKLCLYWPIDWPMKSRNGSGQPKKGPIYRPAKPFTPVRFR
jgi:hypothetical protein